MEKKKEREKGRSSGESEIKMNPYIGHPNFLRMHPGYYSYQRAEFFRQKKGFPKCTSFRGILI